MHIFQQAASLFPAWPASGPEPNASRPPAHSFRRQPATTSRHHSFHTGPTILNQPTPSSQLGRPTPYTSSVLLPLLQPAGQTRNVVSRAGAACKAADGAGEEPAFLFSFFFYFFLLLSFLSSFPSPWRRGFAATPSFFFLLLFFFLFFLFDFFAFLFAFFFLLFSIYFSSDFLFLFFLCPFFLLFLSFYFCSYLCLLFFIFIFVFLLSFYLCFSFLFCHSFCFAFLPSSLQSLSLLSNRSPTIHFFLFRRQSFPFPPATSRQQ